MPPSPEVARTMTRRSVMWWATVGLASAAMAELAWIVSSFVRPRKAPDAAAENAPIVAGQVEDFARESVTAFPAGRFYLARLADGGFIAMDRKCPHLGCTVPWDDVKKRFVCPCHGSTFDIRGEVESPPAPRPLDLFAVRIENGLVKVDLGQRTERQAFGSGQVTFP
jgi:cytochrome b6-f complex iron-sulfur subunit